MPLTRREVIRKLWHITPGVLGAPIILFTPKWITLMVVWILALIYALQHFKLRRGWRIRVPIAEISYKQMARKDELEGNHYLGSFLFWITMALICTIFPKLVALSALWVSTVGDCFNAIVGQLIGGPRIPWNKGKTVIGSLTMFILAFLMLILSHLAVGMDYDVEFLGVVALIAALIESFPIYSAWDEFTVPMATALMLWLFHGGELLNPVW